MRQTVLLDTGPLVAFLSRRDRYHAWALELMSRLQPPLLTCEAVLSEAIFLVRALPRGAASVIELVDRGLLSVEFRAQEHAKELRRLLERYGDRPISLADACLVRMSELHSGSAVLTLDSDFSVYRRHGRQTIPTIQPRS